MTTTTPLTVTIVPAHPTVERRPITDGTLPQPEHAPVKPEPPRLRALLEAAAVELREGSQRYASLARLLERAVERIDQTTAAGPSPAREKAQ